MADGPSAVRHFIDSRPPAVMTAVFVNPEASAVNVKPFKTGQKRASDSD
jgi:hypothetical protein